MTPNDDELSEYFSAFEFGPGSEHEDGEPRIWYQFLDGKEVVFCLAPGEDPDDEELTAFAENAMEKLRAEHPECVSLSFRVEGE